MLFGDPLKLNRGSSDTGNMTSHEQLDPHAFPADIDTFMSELFGEFWTLSEACVAGDVDTIAAASKLSSEYGEHGESLLHIVSCVPEGARRTQILQLLLDAKCDPNAADFDDESPLHYACVHDKSAYYELLLAAGADPHAKFGDNYTPYEMVQRDHSVGCMALMMSPVLPGPETWLNGDLGLPSAVAQEIMRWL